jgi:hypothetical protein
MSEIERDREIDAAWSAASREEPPPALDAAIRAEARRAVGARPGRAQRRHWSYPLAAAATVAALAVGIAQLTPPEQVAPTTVAMQSASSGEATSGAARQAPVAQDKPAATAEVAPSPPFALSTPAKPQPRDAGSAPRDERQRMASSAPAAPRKKQVLKEEAEEASGKTATQPPAKPAERESSTVAGTLAAQSAAPPPSPPRSEAFPAAPANDTRRDTYAEGPLPRTASAAAVAPAPASADPAAAAPPAPAVGAVAQRRADAPMENKLAMAKVANADEAKAKDVSGLSVEGWIRRIRELKSEGRLEEAAKELAAFRAAFGERADTLLPSDLRASGGPAAAKP